MLNYEELKRELKQYKVEIRDPLKHGIKALSEDKVKVQGYLDRVSQMFADAIENQAKFQEVFNDKEFEYDRKKEQAFIEDAVVRDQKSESMRTAAANLKNAAELKAMHAASQQLLIAETYTKYVQHIKENLVSQQMTTSDLRHSMVIGIATGEINIKMELGDAKGQVKMMMKGASSSEDF